MDVTFNFTVPPLPDNDIWFANSAAWNSYWTGIEATISLANATTTVAGLVKKADNLVYTSLAVVTDSY